MGRRLGRPVIAVWILAALASGVSCGVLGVYLVGFEMPLLGIAMAHAALAGAVVAHLAHLPAAPLAAAAAMVAGVALARLARSRARADLGALTSIILSVSMGVAFLGIGMARGEMSDLLALLWGNILFVRRAEAVALVVLVGALWAFLYFAGPMLDALIFSRRSEAWAFDPRYVLAGFMALAALVITANLQFVGGLLIYALLANPAAAAYELAESMAGVRRLAVAFSVAATLGGLGVSWLLNLPTGACVVLLSALIYAFALAARRLPRAHVS
jgi:manganese/iron transport system permease protein